MAINTIRLYWQPFQCCLCMHVCVCVFGLWLSLHITAVDLFMKWRTNSIFSSVSELAQRSDENRLSCDSLRLNTAGRKVTRILTFFAYSGTYWRHSRGKKTNRRRIVAVPANAHPKQKKANRRHKQQQKDDGVGRRVRETVKTTQFNRIGCLLILLVVHTNTIAIKAAHASKHRIHKYVEILLLFGGKNPR